MPIRRKATAPQRVDAVIVERIAALEDQVKQLRQAAASHIQPEDMSDVLGAFAWQMMLHWPGQHRPATPESTLVYYHPGRVDQATGEEVEEGWKQVAPPAVHAIKVYGDIRRNKVREGAFRFDIEEDLADTKIVAVAAFNGTPGTGVTTVQMVNMTRGITLLNVPITIDSGESNSYTAAVDPQINKGGLSSDPNNKVRLGDTIWINVTAVGTDSRGLGVYITFA